MIYYHPQLMQTDRDLQLFLVSNPTPFRRFVDHEAALEIQVHEMVYRALDNNEDVVGLIEEYLGIAYIEGHSPEDMARLISQTDQMRKAMHTLRENWQSMDESAEEDSIRFGGPGRKKAVEQYYERDLRTYLEALSTVYND